MNEILKRLEIIKSALSIEDDEIVELQIMKLTKLDVDDAIKTIIYALEVGDFADALKQIESYLKRYSGVVEYIDVELQALKLELKKLKSTLQELIIEKTEYLNSIDEFNARYNLHLGEIIKTILNLKKEILYKKTIKIQKTKAKYEENIKTFEDTKATIAEIKSAIDEIEEALENLDEDDENYNELAQAYQELQEELDKLEDDLKSQEEELKKIKEFIEDDEVFQEYEDVKSSYDEFENEYKNIKDEYESKIAITDEEKIELKKLYKKTARLCHPDIVPDELKEQANAMMQKLNDAYSKQDLKEVKKILKALESGSGFELSSDSINDKELLKEKIEEFKENISHLETEIEDIKHDETYQLISELQDWDEYFEELKSDLEEEKERLEKEASEVLEEKSKNEDIPEWMQKLWDWADDNNVPSDRFSRQVENLKNISTLDLMGLNLKSLPDEIANLENLTTLILLDNELTYLPRDIVKLINLKKLNLLGNPHLALTKQQKIWLENLEKTAIVFKDKIRDLDFQEVNKTVSNDRLVDQIIEYIVSEFKHQYRTDLSSNFQIMTRINDEAKKVTSLLFKNDSVRFTLNYITYISNKPINIDKVLTRSMFGMGKIDIIKNDENKFDNSSVANPKKTHKNSELKQQNKEKIEIQPETNPYSKHILSIENIRFERIRKYCENLLKENKADDMQKYLSENGRMHKALMYDTLEQFIEKLNGQSITLIDWGCEQGVGSMLVLDYIKEKQLEIIVNQVILVDNNPKKLSRAMAQVDSLKQNELEIIALESNNGLERLKSIKNNTTLNLIVNDTMPVDTLKIDFHLLKNAYFVCLSNKSEQFINNFYEDIALMCDNCLSKREGKIGKFERYEMILFSKN